MLCNSPLRFMMCDLEIEENLFSNTFQTSIVEVQPTVTAMIEGDRVELMKVSNAFSFDFQIKKSGFRIEVKLLERPSGN